MWPFSKPKVTVYRTKKVDWDKVTTVEEVITILKGIKLTQEITVGESFWNDPVFKNILGDCITKKTFIDGCLDKTEESDGFDTE